MRSAAPLSFAIALLALLSTAGAARAVPIGLGSEIGMIGTFTPTGGTDLSDATGLMFDDGIVIIGSNDFAGQVGGSVSFVDLSLTGPLPGGAWLTTVGGLSFTIASLTVDLQTDTALNFTVTGTWSLGGFDDTPGFVVWTGDEFVLNTSSSSGGVVPEPGSAVLIGGGLMGLAVFGRRRRTH